MKFNRLFLLLFLLLLACRKDSSQTIPVLADETQVEKAKIGEIAQQTMGFGIAIGSGRSQVFEVNIDSKSSERVRVGQKANVYLIPSSEVIPCRITRVAQHISRETGQSLAWLKSETDRFVPSGEFVSAKIITGLKQNILIIPKSSVLVRDGSTWAIHKKGEAKEPIQIALGEESEDWVEVKTGLKESDQVVLQGGIGLLSPSFLQKGGGD